MIYYEKNGVVIRDAKIDDVDALKDRLREADVQEIIASGSKDAESELRASFARSTLRFSVDIDSTPAAMFGIVPYTIVGSRAIVWFLGAPEMSRIKKTFVKISRQVIVAFLRQYPALYNSVDCRYVATIRWLESCGAIFGSPFKINGFDFAPFVIGRA